MIISNRIAALEESATLQVAALCQQLRAEGVDVIGLSLGEPDFPAPAHVKQAAIDAVKQLSTDVGIPADLKEIVKEEDLDFLSESAFADACRPGNPRPTSVEEIKELYKSLL